MIRGCGRVIVSTLIASASAGTAQLENAALVRVADIPLGGNTTRLDYESLDQGRHLLFIAHLGASEVVEKPFNVDELL